MKNDQTREPLALASGFYIARPDASAFGSLVLIAIVITHSVAATGDPALPGHHPLTQAQAGSVLISELRCAACHGGIERGSLPEKAAPDLAEVSARVAPDFLRRFLASPTTVHPGTTMPDVLAARPESERQAIADALTHFLIAQSAEKGSGWNPNRQPMDRQLGKSLFHSIGCVACHGPREPPDAPQKAERNDEEVDEDPALAARKKIKPIAVPLAQVAAKYSVKSLSEFLFQPSAFTHPYHAGYGGPEIEQHKPAVRAVSLSEDGLSTSIALEKLDQGFVYELDLVRLRSRDKEELLHRNAFYTVNEIPAR